MISSINSVLYKAGGNLARPTKFEAFLSLPQKVGVSTDYRNYNILLKTASIPAHSNEELQIYLKGHPINIPGRTNYVRKITCTFLIDAQEKIVKDLSDWMHAMDISPTNDSKFDTDNLSEKPLFGSLTINTYDLNFTVGTTYKFQGLYPTSISSIEFNGDQISSVLELSVDFSFYYMEVDSPDGISDTPLTDILNKGSEKALEYVNNLIKNNSMLNKYRNDIVKGVNSITKKEKFMSVFN